MPHAPIARNAVDAVKVASGVEGIALVEEQHFAGDAASLRMALKGGGYFCQPVGVGFGVVVEQDDDAALGGLPTGVARAGKPLVFWQLDEFHFRVVLGDEILGAIGGTVVNQQHFKIREGLLAQGLEAVVQVLFPVQVRDDDGDGWCHVASLC